MAKVKKAFFCSSCGAESPKWMGKCPSCNEWNTLVEEVIQKETAQDKILKESGFESPKNALPIHEIKSEDLPRKILKDPEFNRVLGGGLVPGSLVLIGGEPGIGKSTLLLQFAMNEKDLKILYVSGEESANQIKLRADRLNVHNEQCYVLTETKTVKIFEQVRQIKPDVLIVDSIQTLQSDLLDSAPGSVSQIKECTSEIMRFAKVANVPTLIVGHITKEGSIAGPKMLEHMVDTVLYFEGDQNYLYRLLRTTKNRFGSTNELGIYEMRTGGLEPIENPSKVLSKQGIDRASGVCVGATVEGARPIMIEVQALVSTAVYGTPQRNATGFEAKRLNMLLAVLEKRCGFRLGQKDVFLNFAGGLKVDDPAIDLSVVIAVLSSNADKLIPRSICFAAEIGLSGELRPVSRMEQRVAEAEKLGYEEIVFSSYDESINQSKHNIALKQFARIEQVFAYLFS